MQLLSQTNVEKTMPHLFFHESCTDTIREFALYRWNENTAQDVPIKENDHAMDDLRYFVSEIFDEQGKGEDFFVGIVRR